MRQEQEGIGARTLPLTLGVLGHTPVGRGSSPPRPAQRKPGEGELANIQASKSQTDDHTCHFGSECSALIRPLRKRSSSDGAPAQGHPEKTGIKCSSLHVKCFISSA